MDSFTPVALCDRARCGAAGWPMFSRLIDGARPQATEDQVGQAVKKPTARLC